MAGSIRHVIFTRFNIPSPGRERSLRAQPGWLAGRFDLFRRYCLPSVAGQSERDFAWVIFFGEETPAEYRAEIAALQAIFPFEAVFTGLADMPEIVAGVLPRYSDADWLLSTRLDSDDILAVDFVARLRAAITPGVSQTINFEHGAILSTSAGAPRLYEIVDRKNPFASLIEPMGADARSIWGEYHVNIARLGPVRQVGGAPGWLQVVHGGNVSNRVKGRRVRVDSRLDIFPLLGDVVPAGESNVGILSENLLATPFRQARGLVRYVDARMRGL